MDPAGSRRCDVVFRIVLHRDRSVGCVLWRRHSSKGARFRGRHAEPVF